MGFNYRYWFVIIVLASMSLLAIAQENITATPAPSKTPSPPATSTTTTAEGATDEVENSFAGQGLPRSYTQEDLSVLVGNVQRPNGIVYFDDYLFAACNGDWTLYRIDAETGATITFVYGPQNIHTLIAETTDLGFNLWLPDFDTNQLFRIDQRQSAPDIIADEQLDGPWGIATLDAERFLVTNVRADNIVAISRAGDIQELVTGLRSPAGIVVANNFAYVANNGSARRAIEWFSTSDLPGADEPAIEGITQPLVSGLQNASNLVLGADNYLYFTYSLGTRGVVGRVDPEQCRDDGCSNEQVEIVLFTELPAPLAGLTISPDMRLFVHTIYRPEIYWVDLYQ